MTKTFNTARANLSHSQSLMDKMHAPQPQEMAQPSPEMQLGQTQEPPQPPQEIKQEEQTIAQTIKDTLTPFMDEITKLVSNKTPQEAVLKVPATMEPPATE